MKRGVLSMRPAATCHGRLRFNIQKRERAVLSHARHRDHISAIGAEVQMILSGQQHCSINYFPFYEYFLLGLDVWRFKIVKLSYCAHSLNLSLWLLQ